MNQRILRRNKLSWTNTTMCQLWLFACKHYRTQSMPRHLRVWTYVSHYPANLLLEKGLKSIDDIISADAPERSMIQQCSEQLSDYKRDLTAVYKVLLSKDIDDNDKLATFHLKLEKTFDISQRVKQLSITPVPESTSASTSSPDGPRVRLSKLNVPTFDRNIVHWKQFC